MSKMISYKLPCGTKMNYPEKLGYLTRKGKAIIFHSRSFKNYKAYAIIPKQKGVELIKEGTVDEIVIFYEGLNLEEHTIIDENGVFFYKVADNYDDMRQSIASSVTANLENPSHS